MVDSEIENIQEVVIAVKDAKQAVSFFEDALGLKFDIEWSMPNEKMNVKAAQIGLTQLHIVESTSSDGVIGKFIENKGQGLHHIAFKVNNLTEWVRKLKAKGVILIPAEPIQYPKGWYIFIHPKSAFGVLIELIEHKVN
jgi:methylmalonyl-CoA/ethylmalonyl-CoA epimerase